MQRVSYYLLLKTTRRHLYTFILQDFLREACHQIPIVYPLVGDRSPCPGIAALAGRKKRVGEQLRGRLGVSLHDCEKKQKTFSCNHPILIRL